MSEIIINRKFILKSQNTHRTPMYAVVYRRRSAWQNHPAAAAFGGGGQAWKGGGVEGRRGRREEGVERRKVRREEGEEGEGR